jgi:hypothetical protein
MIILSDYTSYAHFTLNDTLPSGLSSPYYMVLSYTNKLTDNTQYSLLDNDLSTVPNRFNKFQLEIVTVTPSTYNQIYLTGSNYDLNSSWSYNIYGVTGSTTSVTFNTLPQNALLIESGNMLINIEKINL